MDHVYYLNENDNEYDNLINGVKKMLCLGVDWKKMTYSRIFIGDEILFANKSKIVLLKSEVVKVNYFSKLSRKERHCLLNKKKNELMLTKKKHRKLKRKAVLIFVTINDVEKVESDKRF